MCHSPTACRNTNVRVAAGGWCCSVRSSSADRWVRPWYRRHRAADHAGVRSAASPAARSCARTGLRQHRPGRARVGKLRPASRSGSATPSRRRSRVFSRDSDLSAVFWHRDLLRTLRSSASVPDTVFDSDLLVARSLASRASSISIRFCDAFAPLRSRVFSRDSDLIVFCCCFNSLTAWLSDTLARRLPGSTPASESSFVRRATSACKNSASFAARRTAFISSTAAVRCLRLVSKRDFHKPASLRAATSAQRSSSQRADHGATGPSTNESSTSTASARITMCATIAHPRARYQSLVSISQSVHDDPNGGYPSPDDRRFTYVREPHGGGRFNLPYEVMVNAMPSVTMRRYRACHSCNRVPLITTHQ